jgi:hypothetical protein
VHAGRRPRQGLRPGRRSRSRGTWGLIRSFWVAAALYLALAVSIAFGAVDVLRAHSPAASPTPGAPKYLVLIVLDGARPDYLDLTPLPHLDALRRAGTQYTNAISGILEAETPSGHATIATGSRPAKNGILGFDWANDNDRYSLFDPAKMDDLVQILQDSHAPTIGSLYKQRYPQAKVVALSGHKYYAAAPLGGPAADAIMYYQGDPKGHYVPVAVPGHVPPASLLSDPSLTYPTTHLQDSMEDTLATNLAVKTVTTMRPRILLINYPEFDWPLGHVDGGSLDPAKVITDIKGFDADLGSLEDTYRRAGILDQTLFAITADHGMMPITRFVPASILDNAVSQAGTTAPDIASATASFIWLADATKAQAVAQNVLNAHDPGVQSAYYLTTANNQPHYTSVDPSSVDAATETANQYLLGALLNGHQPDVVVFGKEGATFSDPKSGWKADHGGNSWESQHVPLILSGPGIRAGQVTSAPAQLEDVAPTVLADLGVSPAGMEGHVLSEALLQPGSTAQRTRTAEINQLAPDLTALSSPDPQKTG